MTVAILAVYRSVAKGAICDFKADRKPLPACENREPAAVISAEDAAAGLQR
jgi:hypothetical protein